MGESSMAVAAAEVMIYNENRKKWQAPDGVDGQISSVQILHNAARQTFRIIAIREQDGAWVLNCNIHHKLRYHTAKPTFHQWRDEQRQVYGLNFFSEKEARDFVSAVGQAIDYLNHHFVHGGEYQVPNDNVYQDPHQHMISHIQSAPSFRDQEDSSSANVQISSTHPGFRKSSHSVQGNAALTQQQRRSSQGSSSSSSGPCNMYHQQQTSSPSRVAPGPPAPSATASTSCCPPATPSQPPTSTAPPPPPPPPPNLLKSNISKGTSLVDQLRGAQLKKTCAPKDIRSVSTTDPSSVPGSNANVAGSSHGDLLSELAATFNRKKITQAKADAADSKSNASNGSSDSGCGTIPPVNGFAATNTGNVPRKWEPPKTNGSTESPKTHRKVPSGSSISSQEEVKSNGTLLSGSTITPEFLERFKADLMVEMRLEINKAKEDIIETLRTELARR